MTWLVAASAVVWIAIFFYIVSLDREQKKISAEIDELKTKLGDGG